MAKRKKNRPPDDVVELFDQQQIGIDDLGEILICPLCLHAFDREAIQPVRGGAPLSIEHAPQRSHGHSHAVERCLTCRRCNNECGFEARCGERQVKRSSEVFLVPGESVRVVSQFKVKPAIHLTDLTQDGMCVRVFGWTGSSWSEKGWVNCQANVWQEDKLFQGASFVIVCNTSSNGVQIYGCGQYINNMGA